MVWSVADTYLKGMAVTALRTQKWNDNLIIGRMKSAWAPVALVLLSCSFTQAQNPSKEYRSVRERIVGTWTLVSTEEKLRDGTTRPYPDLGPNAVGYLMYTAEGHMCAAMMKPLRESWLGEYATDREKVSAGSGFSAYCGTYAVDEKNRVITHYPEVSYSPNDLGTAQRRPYKFEGSRLIFSDVESNGEVESWKITWEKAPPAPARK